MTEASRKIGSPALLAQAAWKELNAKQSLYHAALLRSDAKAAETIRREAHDLLDSCLDLNGEIAQATINILGR